LIPFAEARENLGASAAADWYLTTITQKTDEPGSRTPQADHMATGDPPGTMYAQAVICPLSLNIGQGAQNQCTSTRCPDAKILQL
jgi:hypothetical protein